MVSYLFEYTPNIKIIIFMLNLKYNLIYYIRDMLFRYCNATVVGRAGVSELTNFKVGIPKYQLVPRLSRSLTMSALVLEFYGDSIIILFWMT